MKNTIDKIFTSEYFSQIKSVFFLYLVDDNIKSKYKYDLINSTYGICEVDIHTIIDNKFILDKSCFFEIEGVLYYSFCFSKSEYENSLGDFHKLLEYDSSLNNSKFVDKINIFKKFKSSKEKAYLYVNILSFGFTHFKFKFSHMLTADRIVEYMTDPFLKNSVKLAKFNFFLIRSLILSVFIIIAFLGASIT